MTLETLSGNGVLYADAGATRVAEIKYHILHTLAVGRDAESWHGTFTTPLEVIEHESYYVQLEDGRRGSCELSMGTRAMGGIPAVYHYSFKGGTLMPPGTTWEIPADISTDESVDESTDESTDESADESTDESTDKSADESE